jgi:DNA-binding CsgD family transcriptional regulator
MYWQPLGHLREGQRWLELALERAGRAPSVPLGRALISLALIRWNQGHHDDAQRLALDAIAVTEEIGDAEIFALSTQVLGLAEFGKGQLDRAGHLLDRARLLWREIGDRDGEALTLMLLSGIAFGLGEVEVSERRAEESLSLFRAAGHYRGAAAALACLARVARHRGEDRRAAFAFHEAFRLCASVGDRWFVLPALTGLAELASAYDRPVAAAALIGAVDALTDELGVPMFPTHRVNYDRAAERTRTALGAVRFTDLCAAGRRTPPDEIVDAVVDAVAAPSAEPADQIAGFEPSPRPVLSSREQEILGLLVQRRTDKEIAAALSISPRTVTTHITHIFAKLGVANRREAAASAVRRGLV